MHGEKQQNIRCQLPYINVVNRQLVSELALRECVAEQYSSYISSFAMKINSKKKIIWD